eukprot:3048212-Alexandrium_andersonii.AAC.1
MMRSDSVGRWSVMARRCGVRWMMWMWWFLMLYDLWEVEGKGNLREIQMSHPPYPCGEAPELMM